MNRAKDFHKKPSGVIINTNAKDFQRARNRNFMRREQEKMVGENGKVAQLESEIAELKALLKQVISGGGGETPPIEETDKPARRE